MKEVNKKFYKQTIMSNKGLVQMQHQEISVEEHDLIMKENLSYLLDGSEDKVATGFGSGRDSVDGIFPKLRRLVFGEKMLETARSLNSRKNIWLFKKASCSKQKKIVEGYIKDLKQSNEDKITYVQMGEIKKSFELAEMQRMLHSKLIVYAKIAKTTVSSIINDFYAEGEKAKRKMFEVFEAENKSKGVIDLRKRCEAREKTSMSEFLNQRGKEEGIAAATPVTTFSPRVTEALSNPETSYSEYQRQRQEHDEFMAKYEEDRSACPECGSNVYSTTLMGYVLDMNDKEAYVDYNSCTCAICQNVHIFHNRVPTKED